MIRRLVLALFVPGLAMAQAMPTTNPRIDAILKTAKAECIASVKAMDANAPVPELMIEPGALTWLDLDGEEEKNDAVVDFNHILCSQDYALWHGSGGSILHLVINGERSASWTGGYWRVTEFFGTPLMLIGRHGTACDGYGAQPCVQAISVFDDGFSTIRFPEPMEEPPAK